MKQKLPNCGQRLKDLRGDMSLDELSEKINIPKSTLWRFESDVTRPNDQIKKKIADFYKKTIQEIFYQFQQHTTHQPGKGEKMKNRLKTLSSRIAAALTKESHGRSEVEFTSKNGKKLMLDFDTGKFSIKN